MLMGHVLHVTGCTHERFIFVSRMRMWSRLGRGLFASLGWAALGMALVPGSLDPVPHSGRLQLLPGAPGENVLYDVDTGERIRVPACRLLFSSAGWAYTKVPNAPPTWCKDLYLVSKCIQ